jgi:hypothetical protein
MIRAGAVVPVIGRHGSTLPALPDRCARRADVVRGYAERLEVTGQRTTDLGTIGRRIGWDAHAAAEFPRAMMADCVDLAAVRPDLAAYVWHHGAGAMILGPGCDCDTPAGHRDQLVILGRALRTVHAGLVELVTP